MNLATFEQLSDKTGQAALAAATALAPSEATLVGCLKRLEKQFDRELSRAALQTVMLRERARAKFSLAEVMYFEREALEQASSEIVARHRARRFVDCGTVGDFCCGIGGDAIELARRGPVVAVDLDSLRLAMARANVAACVPAATAEFRLGDLTSIDLPEVRAAFFDPDRRAGGRRHVSMRDYVPAPDALLARLPRTCALGMKVAPAISWDELRGHGAEVEFISLDGELKECVLWFGLLRTTRRRATVLPTGESIAADESAESRVGPVREYLFDPDPAVTRAGLVADLGRMLDAQQIDAEIAFLGGDKPILTPFARIYRIEASLPFHAGRLRDLVRERNVGRVTIIKRGSAVNADALRKQLKLRGDEHRVVILTRIAGSPAALVGEAMH